MKKAFFLMCALFCASVMQAVTINWTGTFTRLKDHGAIYALAVADTKDAAIATLKNYYLDGGANIGSIKLRPNTQTEMANIHTYVLSNNGQSWGASMQGLTLDGEPSTISGSITVLRQDKDTYQGLEPNAITLVFFDAKEWASTNVDNYRTNSDLLDAYQLTDAERDLVVSGQNIDVNVGKVTIVPEPTALALLALGVAGVALRRRHHV